MLAVQWLDANGLVIEDIVLSTDVGGLVIKNTTPMVIIGSLIARATALIVSSSNLTTKLLMLITLVLSHQFWWFTWKFLFIKPSLKISYFRTNEALKSSIIGLNKKMVVANDLLRTLFPRREKI